MSVLFLQDHMTMERSSLVVCQLLQRISELEKENKEVNPCHLFHFIPIFFNSQPWQFLLSRILSKSKLEWEWDFMSCLVQIISWYLDKCLFWYFLIYHLNRHYWSIGSFCHFSCINLWAKKSYTCKIIFQNNSVTKKFTLGLMQFWF